MDIDREAQKKEAKRLYDIAYRAKNKEKIRAYKHRPDQMQKARERENGKNAAKREARGPIVRLTEEQKAERRRACAASIRERFPERNKQYYEANKERLLAQKHEYYLKNKKKIIDANNARTKENPKKRAAIALYGRIYKLLIGKSKSLRTMQLVGCTPEDFRKHIESQFKEGMSWDNYGRNGWHIDHILPCSLFDLTDVEQQKRCFHYTNLRPLWALDNIRKSNRFDGEMPNQDKTITPFVLPKSAFGNRRLAGEGPDPEARKRATIKYRSNPENKAKEAAYAKQRYEMIKADPEKYAALLEQKRLASLKRYQDRKNRLAESVETNSG